MSGRSVLTIVIKPEKTIKAKHFFEMNKELIIKEMGLQELIDDLRDNDCYENVYQDLIDNNLQYFEYKLKSY